LIANARANAKKSRVSVWPVNVRRYRSSSANDQKPVAAWWRMAMNRMARNIRRLPAIVKRKNFIEA
jgi:hypothetical protein